MKDGGLNRVCAVYCAALCLLWGAAELWLVPLLEPRMSDAAMTALKEIVWKLPVWLLPALLLCRRFTASLFIPFDALFTVRKTSLKAIPVFLLFAAFFAAALVRNGRVVIQDSFGAVSVLEVLSIGLSEEMVFRGWLLNADLRENRVAVPVLVNSVLFLLIHFPIWIRLGVLADYITSGLFLEILVLSAIFSWSFIKTGNIVVPAALHAFWDLLCFLFVL